MTAHVFGEEIASAALGRQLTLPVGRRFRGFIDRAAVFGRASGGRHQKCSKHQQKQENDGFVFHKKLIIRSNFDTIFFKVPVKARIKVARRG